MTPAEVDAYQTRLREVLDERRRLAGDLYPQGGRGRFMSLLAQGQPSQRKQAGLS